MQSKRVRKVLPQNIPRTRIEFWPGEGLRVGVEVGSKMNENFSKFAYAEHVKEL